jgi:hypothetical protein
MEDDTQKCVTLRIDPHSLVRSLARRDRNIEGRLLRLREWTTAECVRQRMTTLALRKTAAKRNIAPTLASPVPMSWRLVRLALRQTKRRDKPDADGMDDQQRQLQALRGGLVSQAT